MWALNGLIIAFGLLGSDTDGIINPLWANLGGKINTYFQCTTSQFFRKHVPEPWALYAATIDKVIFWIMLERVFFSIKRFPAKKEGISENLLPFPLLLYHLTSACYSHLCVRESLFSKYVYSFHQRRVQLNCINEVVGWHVFVTYFAFLHPFWFGLTFAN